MTTPFSLAIALVLAAGAAAPLAADETVQFVEHNGVFYQVFKSEQDGQRITLYHDGQRAYTPAELRAHLAAQPPMILSRPLQQRLAAAAPGDVLDLVVILRSQPTAPIAREVWAKVDPLRQELSAQVQALTRKSLPQGLLPANLERGFEPQPLAPEDQAAREALNLRIDDLLRDARQEIARRAAAAVVPDQDALAAFVAGLGGDVHVRIAPMNALGVRLTAAQVNALAQHALVAHIDLDHPGTPELDNHQHSLGLVNGFWAAGIEGAAYDVGVLDTGVRQSHAALSSHTFLSNMGPNDTETHGTGMAGILASTNATYPGVAKGCDTIVVSRAGSITTSMPGLAYIASTGEPENVNYSFSNGRATDGDYTATDQFFDGVISNFRIMVSKSTGNGGYGTTTITHPAPAFNLLATANMDDFNTIDRANDRITSSSSTGPTLSGRKKPDITSPGNNSMSCHSGGGFANIGGTSAASPHTGGGIVLLFDAGNTDPRACKAVLLNTTDAMTDNGTSTIADDAFLQGSFWNRRYGWGYLNLGAAYLHSADVFNASVTDSGPASFKLYKGPMLAFDKATLVWERHVAYNGSTYPTQFESLSDLDLRAYDQADGALLASSTSAIDSVEQLHVAADADVVLKVYAHNVFDPQVPQEAFSLATQEGFAEAAGPAFAATLIHPATVAPGQSFTLTAEIDNTGDLSAHAVSALLAGLTVTSGDNPAVITTIADGDTVSVNWTVEAPLATGPAPFTIQIDSSSYGETFSATINGSVDVGSVCPADFDTDGALTLADFVAFRNAYVAGDLAADFDGDGALTLNDFVQFRNAYTAGCP